MTHENTYRDDILQFVNKYWSRDLQGQVLFMERKQDYNVTSVKNAKV
jgi:hypothetical protein